VVCELNIYWIIPLENCTVIGTAGTPR